MDLHTALTTAERFLGDENPYNCVTLRPGRVLARSVNGGCDLPCPDVDVDCSVHGTALKKIADAVRGEPVELAMVKGRKLQITAAGSRWTIQAIPAKAAPEHPAPPKKGAWVELPEARVYALAAIDKLADKDGPLAGVRLTSDWAAAGTQAQAAVVWAPFAPEPLTAPPGFFRGVAGVHALLKVGNRLWIRDEDTAVRWTMTLAHPWPDQALMQMVTQTRAAPGRVEAVSHFGELHALVKRALAIADTKIACYTLQLDGTHLSLRGGDGSSSWGATEFTGSIEAASPALGSVAVGGFDLERVARVLATLGGDHKLGVAPNHPCALWAGEDVVVECLITPVYMP